MAKRQYNARPIVPLSEALRSLEVVSTPEVRMITVNFLREVMTSVRIVRGLSRDELGDKVGVDRNSIKRWEEGAFHPHLHNVEAWANALDMDVYIILVPKDTKDSSNEKT